MNESSTEVCLRAGWLTGWQAVWQAQRSSLQATSTHNNAIRRSMAELSQANHPTYFLIVRSFFWWGLTSVSGCRMSIALSS